MECAVPGALHFYAAMEGPACALGFDARRVGTLAVDGIVTVVFPAAVPPPDGAGGEPGVAPGPLGDDDGCGWNDVLPCLPGRGRGVGAAFRLSDPVFFRGGALAERA